MKTFLISLCLIPALVCATPYNSEPTPDIVNKAEIWEHFRRMHMLLDEMHQVYPYHCDEIHYRLEIIEKSFK